MAVERMEEDEGSRSIKLQWATSNEMICEGGIFCAHWFSRKRRMHTTVKGKYLALRDLNCSELFLALLVNLFNGSLVSYPSRLIAREYRPRDGQVTAATPFKSLVQ
jgi:hypothetical protein